MEPLETVPVMELAPQDINQLVEAWRVYHRIYSPLCQRREPRAGAEKYLHGWLLEIPRQSIEPMVLALEGANPHAVRALPRCISEGAWQDEALLERHWPEVEKDLGDEPGVLTLDGSDFLQQGQESVGVKRQYGGEVGQRATCQAGVYWGSASHQGYTLVDRRLSLPQEWVEAEAYAERRRTCGGPLVARSRPSRPWGGR